ncbi:CDP-glycerol glycerophosphotransferase family protein [Rummeliibacillus pycnus]|uniref:CDP-glycerol glycerophosphotransferase family protein n=1 Tax=Rummeliibacillus pycnus TaxID=101070 RepID=UPI003D27FE2F
MTTLKQTKNKFRKKLDRKFKKEIFQMLYKMFCVLPINNNKISILSDSRKKLSDNFQLVYDELERRHKYEYFLLLKESVTKRKRYLEIIKLAYHIATSKVIMLDDFYPMIYPLKIRKNADLIQIWHAVGAFKTFGYSRVGKVGGPNPNSKNHRNYTKVIVSSSEVAPFYAEGFGVDINKVVPTGVPRTDVFFDEDYKNNMNQKLYEKYPELQGKKVILYAPTFRGNGQSSAHFPMEQLDLESIYEQLDDNVVFLIKHHPFVKKKISIPVEYGDKIKDFTKYPSVNDLLFITDLLITDYSSVCFEYALLNKPMIFYCFDLEEYIESRDFYIPYQDFTPGPIVRTCDEMIQKIKDLSDVEKVDYTNFTNKFFEDLDGQSTERVADLIESCMKSI